MASFRLRLVAGLSTTAGSLEALRAGMRNRVGSRTSVSRSGVGRVFLQPLLR